MAPATKGGCIASIKARLACFPSGEARLSGFAAKGGIKNAPERAPYLPSGAILHTSRGRKPSTRPGGVSRSRTEPLAPRAVRPGGAINPHARKGVSTFGNTGKHRLSLSPDPTPDRAEGRLNPQARQAISLKDGKRYLRLPYLPVPPDPSAFFPLLS